MASIKIKHRHDLSLEAARAKVEEIAKDLKSKLRIDYSWHGDSLKFERSGASGSIDVKDEFVEIDIDLGLALTPMKGKIEKTIHQNLAAALTDKGTRTA